MKQIGIEVITLNVKPPPVIPVSHKGASSCPFLSTSDPASL